MFYCVDTKTGKRHSLHTCNEDAARQILEAKNQAQRQPAINLQIAQAYSDQCRRNQKRRVR